MGTRRKISDMDAKTNDPCANCPENRANGSSNERTAASNVPEESLLEERSLPEILALYLNNAGQCKKKTRQRCISSELQ